MLLNHYKNNPLNITRTDKTRLINYFWSRHKLHPYNNASHPSHYSYKPPKDYELDITQLYEYPYNILNEPLQNHNHRLQPGIVAATAPFNPHKDIRFKKFCYLLILYNEGTIAIGQHQSSDSLQPQKELDLILLDHHQSHELRLDPRAWNRLRKKKNLEPLDNNLFVALHISYDEIPDIKKVEKDLKTVINNFFKP